MRELALEAKRSPAVSYTHLDVYKRQHFQQCPTNILIYGGFKSSLLGNQNSLDQTCSHYWKVSVAWNGLCELMFHPVERHMASQRPQFPSMVSLVFRNLLSDGFSLFKEMWCHDITFTEDNAQDVNSSQKLGPGHCRDNLGSWASLHLFFCSKNVTRKTPEMTCSFMLQWTKREITKL